MTVTSNLADSVCERRGAGRWFVESRFPDVSFHGRANHGWRLTVHICEVRPLGERLKGFKEWVFLGREESALRRADSKMGQGGHQNATGSYPLRNLA